jgi:hypothetical protein
MLTINAKSQRARRTKEKRIEMLCARLDRHVAAAERFRKGATRAMHLAAAELAREQLRQIDH